mgnify:CR=1 FL=1
MDTSSLLVKRFAPLNRSRSALSSGHMSETKQPSPLEAKATIKAKNWSVANLAYRWKVSRETVSRLLSNRRRPPHWNDALQGLPKLTRREALEITLARKREMPQKPRSRISQHQRPIRAAQYDLASILVALEAIGSIADTDDEGLVISVMQGSAEHFYKIEWPGGADIFAESEIESLVADTGRTGIVKNE